MGQYYTPYLKEVRTRKEMTFHSHDYEDNGFKLMEHSYLGNYFVAAVMRCLHHNPCKVVWCGDYADDWLDNEGRHFSNFNEMHAKMKDVLLSIYEKIIDHNFDVKHRVKNKNVDEIIPFCYFEGKIINHTLEVYIDMKKYKDENKNKEYVPHPLPLLTCIGNGLGGGDYFQNSINYDKTGLWANSVIECIDEGDQVPEGYNEVEYEFNDRDWQESEE